MNLAFLGPNEQKSVYILRAERRVAEPSWQLPKYQKPGALGGRRRPLIFVDGFLALRNQVGEPFSAPFETGEPFLEPFAFR